MEEKSFVRSSHGGAVPRSRLQTKRRLKPKYSPRILTWEDSPHAQDTTYYKAVPYTRIPIDTEVKTMLESLEKLRPDEYKVWLPLYGGDMLELVRIVGHDIHPYPIRAGPVLYVKSITICSDKQRCNDFRMFGQISITDLDKNTFYFYNTGPDVYHRVSGVWDLFFCYCPMAPVLGGKLKFSVRNLEGKIFKEDKEFSINYSCKYDCQDDIHQEFPLEGGYYAKMVFNKIPRATIVRCEMFLRYKGTDGVDKDGFYKVRGSVKINNVFCLDDSKTLYMRRGEYGGFDQWGRSVFPLPVGSPLKVEYKLSNAGVEGVEFANGKCEVPPRLHGNQGGPDDIVNLTCKDENYCLGMSVHWYLHTDFFNPQQSFICGLDMKRNVHQKPLQVTSDDDLVEVFSVVVGGVDSAPPVLCGRIVVGDEHGKVYIFARNKDFPDRYSSPIKKLERSVALAWPDRWLARKDFYMNLMLKDANDDLIFVGEFHWAVCSRLCDRRLCEVITDKKGFFAAVHYSVFKNGKKAKVSIEHNEDDGGYSHVYGRVFAAYDNNDDYPSTYDKECYRSIIFNRSKEDCVTVKNRFEIPLSKTHVSTPSDCKELIIDADLCVRPNTTSSYQRATAQLRFEARRNGSQSKQLGGLAVTVDWS